MKLLTFSLLSIVTLCGQSLAASVPTILDLAHATRPPPRLAESVVVIIDAQREYVDGHLHLFEVRAALEQTARLIHRARAAGVPIIHVQQISPAGRGIFDPTGPYIAFAPEAAPLASETIIAKVLPNAFADTSLDATLKKIGRKHLILSGYMTHMCVSATARAALDLGYHSTVIADACATRDLPDVDGGTISAEVVHHVALAELADRFSTVVTTLDKIPD